MEFILKYYKGTDRKLFLMSVILYAFCCILFLNDEFGLDYLLIIPCCAFIIIYSIRFTVRKEKIIVDYLKLIFIITTIFLIGLGLNMEYDYKYHMLIVTLVIQLQFIISFLWYYSVKKKDGDSLKAITVIFIVVQFFFYLGISIWAITQKVEAQHQHDIAITAKEDAIKAEVYSLRESEAIKDIFNSSKTLEKEALKMRAEKLILQEELEKQKLIISELENRIKKYEKK